MVADATLNTNHCGNHMKYSLEEIYQLIGKEDIVATFWFEEGSKAFLEYGKNLTAIVLYTQKEREALDKKIELGVFTTSGIITLKYLDLNKSVESVRKLKDEGVSSDEITNIEYLNIAPSNTFHSSEKRTIQKITIPLNLLPNGKDGDWIYGFYKMLVLEGIGLCPRERHLYLAFKYYFEKENLDSEETEEMFNDGKLKEEIEWELLKFKQQRKELLKEESEKLLKMYSNLKRVLRNKLNVYLNEAGSSLNKLIKEDESLAGKMFYKVLFFKEKRFNSVGTIPIYLDVDRFLHIYTRHVEEMKFNKQFEDKDNFQWEEEDVLIVIGKIIEELNDEIQEFFKSFPGQRYRRTGNKSFYFEGDYYSFYIEPSGLISTFYKKRKAHEGVAKRAPK
jgi:hypothetical protein